MGSIRGSRGPGGGDRLAAGAAAKGLEKGEDASAMCSWLCRLALRRPAQGKQGLQHEQGLQHARVRATVIAQHVLRCWQGRGSVCCRLGI